VKRPPRKVLAARQLRQHFSTGAAVGRVAGNKAGERRRYEADQLIGHPFFGQNPTDVADVGRSSNGARPAMAPCQERTAILPSLPFRFRADRRARSSRA